MGDRGVASDVPDRGTGYQHEDFDPDAGALLGRAIGGTRGVIRHLAPRRPWPPALLERVGSGVWLYSAILHQQPIRRDYERPPDRFRLCGNLSPRRGKDREAVHVLPSRA